MILKGLEIGGIVLAYTVLMGAYAWFGVKRAMRGILKDDEYTARDHGHEEL